MVRKYAKMHQDMPYEYLLQDVCTYKIHVMRTCFWKIETTPSLHDSHPVHVIMISSRRQYVGTTCLTLSVLYSLLCSTLHLANSYTCVGRHHGRRREETETEQKGETYTYTAILEMFSCPFFRGPVKGEYLTQLFPILSCGMFIYTWHLDLDPAFPPLSPLHSPLLVQTLVLDFSHS